MSGRTLAQFEGGSRSRVLGPSGRVRRARNDEPRLPSRPSHEPFPLWHPHQHERRKGVANDWTRKL
jgi:hypothetical protein